MIIARLFTGDADMEVASKQHDVYGQALWIIVSKCHRYTEFARSLLNDADHSEWGTVERFDHRVLQHGHDLLAAVWRFPGNDFQQPVLPFVDKKSLDELQTLWLWLAAPRDRRVDRLSAPRPFGSVDPDEPERVARIYSGGTTLPRHHQLVY